MRNNPPHIGAYEGTFDLTWTGNTDSDWNTAGNWNPELIPAPNANITILSPGKGDVNYPVVNEAPATPAVCNNLTIESGAVLTIATSKALTVYGTLTNSAATGLVVNSGGSLIQNNAALGTVKRYIAAWANPTINHGWHFLSSPVAGQAISPAFTTDPSTNYDFYAWWEPTNQWVNYKNTGTTPTWETANILGVTSEAGNFIPGKGYLVEYAATDTKQFTGTLNKDDITVSSLAISSGANSGWYLLGNPFSSALTWGTGAWSLLNINATAKVWKESTAAYVDVAAGSGIIPSLNGFMVQVTSGTGSLKIPIAARVHDATTAWYKSSGDPSISLVATDVAGQTAQESIIRFNNEATTGFDNDFDSHFLAGYAPQFYSVAGSEMLSTNVLPEAGGSVQVPFNFIKNDGETFTIQVKTITDIQGPVILSDLKTGTSQDLTVNPVYVFSSVAGDAPNRFVLKFSSVGINDTQNENPFTVFASNKEIFVISNNGIAEGNALVYNMMGQLMAQQKLNNGNQTKISLNATTGYYIVKVVTNENAYSSKVFVK